MLEAAGIGLDGRFNSSFRNPTFVNLELRSQIDIVTFVSGSHSFWNGRLEEDRYHQVYSAHSHGTEGNARKAGHEG